jgi:ATP-dependent DNA helicase RecG
MSLNDKIEVLPRLGKTTSKYLRKLGLVTIQDLLFYLPFRYEDFREKKDIASLIIGEEANIQGEILLIQNRRARGRKLNITEALIADDSETIKVIWFNQAFLTKNLKVGDKISLAGKVSENQGQLAMISPQYEKIYSSHLVHTSGLVPMYHLTSGITQKQIRFFIKQALVATKEIKDWLPENTKKNLNLLDLQNAIYKIHFPSNLEEADKARRRLLFADLFFRQLKSQLIKKELSLQTAKPIKFFEKETNRLVSSLPFKLTNDQRKSAWEIIQDLKKSSPMSRLLEGDVGSGKTIVSAIAMLNVALSGYSSVLMAPTEILAHQHFNSINKIFKNSNLEINISLLTGSRKDVIKKDTSIIIGTHAVIQKQIKNAEIALAIVDEQHRFGVRQRQKILDFNRHDNFIPHFLSMTATPIPRSLTLAIYSDLDLSIIKEMPSERKKIITKLVSNSDRKKAYNFILGEIKKGRQTFVICPLIEESDKLGIKSAKTEFEHLQKEVFPDLNIGLLHGKMKSKEKEEIMKKMLEKKTDILVATSVIEVGVDIPNASIIIIEGAERFGLAQLHQFRGRVGRSKYQSYCLLFPSKENIVQEKTITRLKSLEKYHDGFSLAKIDLKLRGAGDLYGDSQSGFNEMQIISLFDYESIKKSKEETEKLIKQDPDLTKHPTLKEKLGHWEKSIHLE